MSNAFRSDRRINSAASPKYDASASAYSSRGSSRRFDMTTPTAGGGAGGAGGVYAGSARRTPSAAQYASASRGNSGFIPLSEHQQTATQSAAAMNHLFNEARREIRRGAAAEKKAEEAVNRAEEAVTTGFTAITPATSSAPPTPRDLETGATSAEEAHPSELNWRTDIQAMKEMLQEEKILSPMLICIPLGIIAYYTRIGGDSAVFILNFVAIIPLAWLLGNATEELAMRSNQTVGGLLNATFGNAVELIVSIVALQKGMIKLVQTSLLGSILSNCLLVLGMSFFLGGLKNKVQIYNQKGAHMLSSLLLLASIALVLPAGFVNSFSPHPPMDNLLAISRVTALLMFIIYVLYLWFQLYTHSEMFDDTMVETMANGTKSSSGTNSENGDEVKPLPSGRKPGVSFGADVANGGGNSKNYQQDDRGSDVEEEEEEEVQPVGDQMKELADLEDGGGYHGDATVEEDSDDDDLDDEDGEDEPSITLACALILLCIVTLAVAACSEYLVDSISAVTQQWGMNEAFVGIILIPIVGNAAEHATAVTVSIKNKMDLAIGVAIGSSTQIALFLIPFVTLLGWIIDEPMSLNFSSFETICLIVAVMLVTALLTAGESNWLQGLMLIALYFIIGTTFWFHPVTSDNPKSQRHAATWEPAGVTSP